MTPSVQETDVLIVGCGPVGALTANLLGQYGVRTLVLERSLTQHNQPRAITCDDEALRIYQSVGLADVLDAHMYTCPEVELVGATGEVFARLGVGSTDFGFGYPALRFFSQPFVERVLREGLARFASVTLRLGQQVEAYTQDEDGASVTVRDVRDGSESTVRARYVLACDGGRSTLRQLAGIDMVGSTYDEGMVAISLLLPHEPPAVSRMVCDPYRHVFVARCAGNELRVEVMIREDEKPEDMVQPERVRAFIAPYVDPDTVTILRAATYVFNRRVAARWRDGRLFLLGDAAHLMPPVLGQGLCSGLRDGANIAWKLAAVLQGHAEPSLLDSYEEERRPHAEAMLEASVNMGRLVLTGSRPVAFMRDRLVRALDRIPRVHRFIRDLEFKPRPLILRGFLMGGGRSHRLSPEGTYFPQPRVALTDGAPVLLDDVLGPGFAVIVRHGVPEASARAAQVLADSLGATCVRLVPPRKTPAQAGEVTDLGGKLATWFHQHDADIAVLRPDRYLFGAVRSSHLSWLSVALRQRIQGPLRSTTPPARAGASVG
ncbi:bifunctional 3-(3-hydroxy-phenyl)propionate/3-hydroxycinnamic acid hydroxylase [Archangium primigenium]|uniref:bifunctional 3-(3-hydroxy-phenyl)propionate/3-hydroxycinnamic acid hydroxylase MhpA n=1 Tax=[Archangium] primigenium TaxID=2792470 RepID=UPI00195D7C8B|nr:bifunctional 3-(3-hydroxy-phenyl)propionate/3-hydroxycinnamic acid hydroxylase [Archangium primigenium]MBM7119288.1 bifunctional 3-(3-hydroxy-phenyl)propionate/3-hydroxycinnamic acid hydroxylase [Archangium primigenium]